MRRRIDSINAILAGEAAHRSDRSRGHQGFAARQGAATPEAALQNLTGVSFSEAKALTTMGAALAEQPAWLTPVLNGVTDGSLSVASAAAITRGLGSPTPDVAADDLLGAATELVGLAKGSTPESTAKSARTLRELLDVAAIADIEAHRYSRRSLKWFEQGDGTTRMTAVLDPESAAIITGAIDTVMSPRRGGPRFVDPADVAKATTMADDPRTNEQLAVDTLVEIVNLATRAANSAIDPTKLFGDRSPAVRVHVQAETLHAGQGAASLEGQSALVSAATAERYVCTVGTIPIIFRGETAIDVGSTQRLHTPKQRIAIAAQWNGCAWPDCRHPAFATEVHHIEAFNGRNTTLDNAVPLCRFHHMQLHANKWRITRDPDGAHWLNPPPQLQSGSPPGSQPAQPPQPLGRSAPRAQPPRPPQPPDHSAPGSPPRSSGQFAPGSQPAQPPPSSSHSVPESPPGPRQPDAVDACATPIGPRRLRSKSPLGGGRPPAPHG